MAKRKSQGGTVNKKVGSIFTKRLTQGPNKGDTVRFKVAPSKKPYPVKTIRDRGSKRGKI